MVEIPDICGSPALYVRKVPLQSNIQPMPPVTDIIICTTASRRYRHASFHANRRADAMTELAKSAAGDSVHRAPPPIRQPVDRSSATPARGSKSRHGTRRHAARANRLSAARHPRRARFFLRREALIVCLLRSTEPSASRLPGSVRTSHASPYQQLKCNPRL